MATLLPYGVHRSYAIITDPDAPGGVGMEADTFTCHHCQFVVHMKPFATLSNSNGLCRQCWKPICTACVRLGTCTPWEAQLEQIEARDRLLRQVSASSPMALRTG